LKEEKFREVIKMFRCPDCGERFSRFKRYCPKCGKKVRGKEPPTFVFSSPTMVAGFIALGLIFLVILFFRFLV